MPERIDEPAAWVECPRCGEVILAEASFCSECGERLTPMAGRFDTPHRRSSRRWLPIALAAGGVLIIGLAAFVAVLLIGGGDLGLADASATATASPSTAAPQPPTSPDPSEAQSSTAAPSTPPSTPTGHDLTGEMVAVVTEDLVVRSRPGTGPDSEIYPALLSAPTIVYVIAGPETANGYEWYLVDPLALPCIIGCDFVPRAGWVAAEGKDGERWLAETPTLIDCPEPTLEEIAGGYTQLSLICFGSDELTLSGGVVGQDSTLGRPPGWQWGWPWAGSIALHGPDYQGHVTGCVDACNTPLVTVAFDGAGELPSPLRAIRVTGHFDDVKAEECRASDTSIDPRIATHMCRMVFVATSWD